MYTLLDYIKHKCRDSYVLYIPTVHAFGLVLLTHTLLVQTHTHDISAPCPCLPWHWVFSIFHLKVLFDFQIYSSLQLQNTKLNFKLDFRPFFIGKYMQGTFQVLQVYELEDLITLLGFFLFNVTWHFTFNSYKSLFDLSNQSPGVTIMSENSTKIKQNYHDLER